MTTTSRLPTLILAIETSNPSARGASCGVAIARAVGHTVEILGVEPLRQGAIGGGSTGGRGGLDDDLMPAIDRLAQRSGITRTDIRLVAASVGPGGYTGLRVAAAAAKLIAEGLGAECVGVRSALAALAASTRGGWIGRGAIAVLLASKGESAWCETFGRDGKALGEGQTVMAADAARLKALGVESALGDQFVPASLAAALEAVGIRVVDIRFDPQAVAEVAARLAPIDALAVNPVYPREPDAVTLWRSRGGSGGKVGGQ